MVAKLLHLTRPDAAYFGQKDAQQLLIIRRMVRDLDFGCEILAVPTVREPRRPRDEQPEQIPDRRWTARWR